MKLYYIDESMFQNSHFSKQVFYRFEKLLLKNPNSLVLISVTGKSNKNIDYFLSSHSNKMILLSPTLFDYESVKGQLHTTFLAIEDFPVMESYSGSVVEYDTVSKQVSRLYLEMFLDHEDIDIDFIVKEMEELLNDKIAFIKKKITLS